MKDKRLAIIFVTVFIDLVGFGIIIPQNPYLARAFGATPLMVGVLMSIYSLMQFIFSPIWGQLSDRIGRRPVILISLLGGGIAHLAFGFSTSLLMLLFARGFAGLFGGNISTAMAYIADITGEKERSKGMGLIGAAFGLGFILGPLIGFVFAGVGRRLGAEPPLGDSFPALIAAAISLINFLVALKYLPESRDPQGTPVIRGNRFRRIFGALTTPTLGGLMLLTFINTFAMAHIEASLFLFVQDDLHWSLRWASLGFGYIGIIMAFTQGFLIRRLMPKVGERRFLITGLATSAAAFAVISNSSEIWPLAFGVTLLGLGNGFVSPALNGSVSLLSGREVQGNNLGVAQSLSSLARILGPASGGLLYQRLGMRSPFIAAALISLVGALIAYRMRARLPEGGRR